MTSVKTLLLTVRNEPKCKITIHSEMLLQALGVDSTLKVTFDVVAS